MDNEAVNYGGFRMSESFGKIAEALADAQGEFPVIEKSREATVKGRTKAGQEYSYDYKYADIADVLHAVRPVLAKNKIAIIQPTVLRGGNIFIVTRLVHASGEWLECEYPVTRYQEERHQAMGGALTYARRYSLCTLIGVAAEEDLDAPEGATGTVSAPIEDRPTSRRQQRAPVVVVQTPEPPPPTEDPDAPKTKPLPPKVGENVFQALAVDKKPLGGPCDADEFFERVAAGLEGIVVGGASGDQVDRFLAMNAEGLGKLPERLKKLMDKEIKATNKRLRAAAVAADPNGGEKVEENLL